MAGAVNPGNRPALRPYGTLAARAHTTRPRHPAGFRGTEAGKIIFRRNSADETIAGERGQNPSQCGRSLSAIRRRAVLAAPLAKPTAPATPRQRGGPAHRQGALPANGSAGTSGGGVAVEPGAAGQPQIGPVGRLGGRHRSAYTGAATESSVRCGRMCVSRHGGRRRIPFDEPGEIRPLAAAASRPGGRGSPFRSGHGDLGRGGLSSAGTEGDDRIGSRRAVRRDLAAVDGARPGPHRGPVRRIGETFLVRYDQAFSAGFRAAPLGGVAAGPAWAATGNRWGAR